MVFNSGYIYSEDAVEIFLQIYLCMFNSSFDAWVIIEDN